MQTHNSLTVIQHHPLAFSSRSSCLLHRVAFCVRLRRILSARVSRLCTCLGFFLHFRLFFFIRRSLFTVVGSSHHIWIIRWLSITCAWSFGSVSPPHKQTSEETSEKTTAEFIPSICCGCHACSEEDRILSLICKDISYFYGVARYGTDCDVRIPKEKWTEIEFRTHVHATFHVHVGFSVFECECIPAVSNYACQSFMDAVSSSSDLLSRPFPHITFSTFIRTHVVPHVFMFCPSLDRSSI